MKFNEKSMKNSVEINNLFVSTNSEILIICTIIFFTNYVIAVQCFINFSLHVWTLDSNHIQYLIETSCKSRN